MSDRTERTRGASPAHLRLMVEHAPAGQGIARLDGVILEVNPTLCALLGRDREQMVGVPFWHFIHADDQAAAGASLARLLAGDRDPDIVEVRFVRGDGTIFDGQVMVTMPREGAGRRDLLVAVITDISERHRANAETARRVAQQEAVAALARFALGATEPSEVLAEARRLVTGLLPTEGAPGATGSDPLELDHYDPADRSFVQAMANVAATYVARHEAETRALQASLHDDLTGLPTRQLFLERADAALARSSGNRASVGILLVDVDRLKLVNNSLGRDAGDDLLSQAADRLRAGLRQEDVLARVGGDEFAILCEGLASADAARALADRLRDTLAPAFLLGGRPVFASASIGIALGSPGSAADLLGAADTAVHQAKASGYDRVELFDNRMHREAAERLALGADLHDALEHHELQVYYQPVVRLRDGAVVGAEALLRWQHPTRGFVSPAEFIPVAEDSGLIVPIGAWVLETACRAAAEWPAGADGKPLKISVNVSSRQLSDPGFAAMVARTLDASGLPRGALCLELTESLLMADVDRSQTILAGLKDLGLCLSVDDFGTGYSSLARLKHFPVDYLKIDRSFVDGLGADSDDEAIVTSIIGLAHSMGLAVVAEGVETDEQRRRLRALRCEGGQGWLWSKAVPDGEFLAWLERHSTSTVSDTGNCMLSAGCRKPGPTRVLVVDDDPDQIELVRILLGAGGFEVIPVLGPGWFPEALRRSAPDLVLMDLRMPGRGGLELIEDVADQGLDLPPVVAVTGHAQWLGRPLEGAERFAGVIAKPIDPEAFVGQVEAFLAGATTAAA